MIGLIIKSGSLHLSLNIFGMIDIIQKEFNFLPTIKVFLVWAKTGSSYPAAPVAFACKPGREWQRNSKISKIYVYTFTRRAWLVHEN